MHKDDEVARLKERISTFEWGASRTNEGLKDLYRELARANERLKALDKLKNHFVASVSHEYKNPIAIIRECFSLLIDGGLGQINDDQQRLLQIGLKTADRLNRLIMDVLDLSKIEAGKLELKMELFDIVAVVNEAIDSCKEIVLKKNQSVERIVANGKMDIFGDKDRTIEVITNLLSNANKYAPDGGKIVVRLKDGGSFVRLEVSDNGPGISADNFDRIFDKYTPLTNEKEGGTGLGLSITKELVELHEGKIWLESKLGEGTTFFVELPKNPLKN